MSARFTPGPWTVEPNVCSESPPSIMISTQDAIIAEVYADDSAEEPECVATANLIAAAPELYEALTAAANALRFHAEHVTYNGSSPEKQRRRAVIMDQANAAFSTLAKARGEQVSA